MNYQPFFDANILISDPFLAELHRLKPAFALLILLTFYAFFFLHMVIFSLYKMTRTPKRNYPAHEKKAVINA